MASATTCNIAVRWKNAAAPIVVAVRRVVITISFRELREAICRIYLDSAFLDKEEQTDSGETWRRIGVRAHDD